MPNFIAMQTALTTSPMFGLLGAPPVLPGGHMTSARAPLLRKMPHPDVPVHVTLVSMPIHPEDETLTELQIAAWKHTLGRIRARNLQFHFIICGTRAIEWELAHIALRTFPDARIFSNWHTVGGKQTQDEARALLGDIASFLSFEQHRRALVLEYSRAVTRRQGLFHDSGTQLGSFVTTTIVGDYIKD